MLDWRKEEEEYIRKAQFEYKHGLPIYMEQQLRLNYREDKFDEMLIEVMEERKRINNLIENINEKFIKYLEEQKGHIEGKIKPFKIEAHDYDNRDEDIMEIKKLELVKIYCEPITLLFLQEKLGSEAVIGQ